MKRVECEGPLVARRWLGIAALVGSAIAGCASNGPTERFFALNDGGVVQATTSVAGSTGPGTSLPGIVISAVTVPELVDRPQIVTRDTTDRVIVSEQNLWAEPVRSGIARTLATRLSRALADAGHPAQVAAYPQSSIANPVIRVTVDIVRYDAVPNGEAVIDALWSVRRVSDGVVRTGRTVASAPIAGVGYDAIVRGWNDALAIVDRDVATTVDQVMASEPKPASR